MAKKALSLEKAFQRLEEILRMLESGEKDLEESIKLYEEGMQLTSQCQKQLQELEQRVKVINADASDNNEQQTPEDETL